MAEVGGSPEEGTIPEARRYKPLDRRGLQFITNDGMLLEVWPSDKPGEVKLAFSFWPKKTFWYDGPENMKIEPSPGRCMTELTPEMAVWLISQIERCLDAGSES